MPTIRNLARLFHAIAEKDLPNAESIANDIAGAEEKTGHHSAAQLLRGALHPNGNRVFRDIEGTAALIPSESFISSALAPRRADSLLRDVVLRADCRKQLESILVEFKHAPQLRSKGIRRRNKLLFLGPPGCGKSLTALALANELRLPHYVVRFDAVIGAYLGQTATHLRQLFQFVSNTPCVLLFDEIDALGKQRGNTRDVGELDRIVIALMQELDLLTAKGIVVAASNLPEHLDRALLRRFDLIVQFPIPKRIELLQFSKAQAKRFKVILSKRRMLALSKVNSYAEAEKFVEDEARRLALAEYE
jgi:SpoVK/Ycf46/Vps4 family AAA+-type ATPase